MQFVSIKYCRFLYTLFSIVLLVFAQACVSNETKPTGLAGSVSSSGVPVADASVSLTNTSQQYTTLTGADGKFQFTGIASGEYILTVKSETTSNGFMQIQKNVSVSASSQPQTVELPKGVTLLDPLHITNSTVDLKWTMSGIDNFLEYKLYRHPTSGLDETTGKLVHVATSAKDTVFTDTDLLDNENYYYRVFVRNTFGLYGGSNILQVTTAEGNYVNNGDFEQNLGGWELFTPNPCVDIVDDITSPSGSKVLKAEIADISTVNISSELFQNINQTKLTGGNTYTLSFWGKVDALAGSGIMYVYLVTTGNWSRWCTIKLTKDSSHEWTKYNADFIAPTSTTPYALFIYAEPNIPWNNEPFKVYLDGIALYRKK